MPHRGTGAYLGGQTATLSDTQVEVEVNVGSGGITGTWVVWSPDILIDSQL